jgi:hypothetical protein
MKRLFVFGCSFTHYAWPSWGDMLGNHFDYVENWGWPGLGNRAIAERISECHAKNSFTKDDTVVVQWSTHVRHDWFRTDDPHAIGWQTNGSIFNYLNEDTFDRKWIEKFWDERAYFMHNMNFMLLVQNMLDAVNCTWFMTTITDFSKLGKDYPQDKKRHGETVNNNIENIWEENESLKFYKTSVFENRNDKWITPLGLHAWKDFSKSYKFRDKMYPSKWTDFHPSIDQHSEWLYNELIPRLGLSQNKPEKTVKWIDTVNKIYNDNSRYDFDKFCITVNIELTDWIIPYRGF